MHPRNIFQDPPPDYTFLAIKYPQFRRVCKLEICGKVCVDYKNEAALRALTQTLLLEYFELNVDFAPGSLIPTLPLRLNYILWLEDLLLKQQKHSTGTISGIDIGCGSSCIFSLLASKKNGWHMVALESNISNLKCAKDNIERNHLKEHISIFGQQKKSQIFEEYFDSQHKDDTSAALYDFCLCNPPFYDSLCVKSNTRNPHKRPPPHNCPTGYKEELSCLGGEVKFVEKIIDESIKYKHNIRFFTSMLGLKSSLIQLLEFLKQRNISNYCTTEFLQGNTTRWGIAWSFFNDIDLKK